MKIEELFEGEIPNSPPGKTLTNESLSHVYRGGSQDLAKLMKSYNGIYFSKERSTAESYGTVSEYNLSKLGPFKVFDLYKDMKYSKKLMEYVFNEDVEDVVGDCASAFITGNKKMVDLMKSYRIDAIKNQEMYLVFKSGIEKL